jgi:amino acid transporter
LGDGPLPLLAYAACAIIGLTLLNLAGIQEGKWTQNLLTTAKVLGLLLLFGVALAWPSNVAASATPPTGGANFALAFILIMFAYGGWNEVSFVAAEVRDPRRNILARCCWASALSRPCTSWRTVQRRAIGRVFASDAVARIAVAIRRARARLIKALVCVTTLGAVNGQIFAGRVSITRSAATIAGMLCSAAERGPKRAVVGACRTGSGLSRAGGGVLA